MECFQYYSLILDGKLVYDYWYFIFINMLIPPKILIVEYQIKKLDRSILFTTILMTHGMALHYIISEFILLSLSI